MENVLRILLINGPLMIKATFNAVSRDQIWSVSKLIFEIHEIFQWTRRIHVQAIYVEWIWTLFKISTLFPSTGIQNFTLKTASTAGNSVENLKRQEKISMAQTVEIRCIKILGILDMGSVVGKVLIVSFINQNEWNAVLTEESNKSAHATDLFYLNFLLLLIK